MRCFSGRPIGLLSLVPVVAIWVAWPGPVTATRGPLLAPMAIVAPHIQPSAATGPAACTAPDGTTFAFFHCYTPAQIATAYGLSALHGAGLLGQGQTIVLVDSYGSPTAVHDLKVFHDTFFPSFPDPNFDQVFPLGAPDFNNTAHGNGISGPNLAAGWAIESTLDIEWAYATAPLAHIVLLATPPAESLGVQGFPNFFKAIQLAVDSLPSGTVFSQSFAATEQDFEGAQSVQTAGFDQVYQAAIAKGDTAVAAAGDFGSTGVSKLAKESVAFPFPTVWWPSSSPFVTTVGGTQLQFGWRWTPTSTRPFLANGDPNPDFFAFATFDPGTGPNSETVWNEPWLPAATGGGSSVIYPSPSWQSAQIPVIGKNARGTPDLAWNAAVNGGVLVFHTAFPNVNGQGWSPIGGTSASTPQVAGLIALANQARAAQHKGPIGNLNPLLYTIGNRAGASSPAFNGSGDFRDIVPQTYGVFTLKDNGLFHFNADGTVSPGTVAGMPTLSGWDMTTGFGTPRAVQFVADVASAP